MQLTQGAPATMTVLNAGLRAYLLHIAIARSKRGSKMLKFSKDVFGIATLVAATAALIGFHSWMFVQ